jgi:hypothetical protein
MAGRVPSRYPRVIAGGDYSGGPVPDFHRVPSLSMTMEPDYPQNIQFYRIFNLKIESFQLAKQRFDLMNLIAEYIVKTNFG